MREEPKYNIKIENSVSASIENIGTGYLQKIYINKLFSNLIGKTKGVIVILESPLNSSVDLSREINNIKQDSRIFKEKKGENNLNDENDSPDLFSFSLIYNKNLNIEYIIDFLALAWGLYDTSYVFFLTEDHDIEYLEKTIIGSKKKNFFLLEDKSLSSYLCYYKDEIEEYIIFLCNRSNLSFDKILNPDPILYINSQIRNGVLYRLHYSDEILKARDLINSVLLELGLNKLIENSNFIINENSSENLLIFDVQSENSIHIQMIIKANQIFFNVDRISDLKSISLDRSDSKLLLKEKLRIYLFSKTKVEYRADVFNTKVYFFNKQGEVLMKLSSDYFCVLNLLVKPVVFNYEPIYQQKS